MALIFCFDNTMHFTMAPLLMALSGSSSNNSPFAIMRAVLWRIFTHPFILATIVGVGAALTGLTLPEPVDRFLQLLANAAAPCALFAMGVTLALRPLKRVPVELTWLVPIKLVIHPLVVWLFLGFVSDVDEAWIKSAMLMASLPAATNVFVIAQQYQVWVERATATVLVTTVLSVATVTLLLYLFSTGHLPISPFG